MNENQRLSTTKPLRIAGFQFLACAVVVFIRLIVVYRSSVWNDPHAISFLKDWLPAVVGVTVGIVPGTDWDKRIRAGWRFLIVILGLSYSSLLWHSETLSDKANETQISDAVTQAVLIANQHADQKFSDMQQQVTSLGGKVDGVGQQLGATANTIAAGLQQATSDLDARIGKVGKPDPPELARLQFSLWRAGGRDEGTPFLSDDIKADGSGNYSVSFLLKNPTGVSADSIDLWIVLCDGCSFASEPSGFDRPSGSDEHMRHRQIGAVNPVTSTEKMTVNVKYAGPSSVISIASRYSCKNCGKPQDPVIAQLNLLPAAITNPLTQ